MKYFRLELVTPNPNLLKWCLTYVKLHISFVLFINDYCHAIVDFAENGAYNRNGFPPTEKNGWVKKGHDWDESKLSLFK
ncbi:MAG: DUF2251 domain-containing protein, partial [Cyanobacteria bacterium J06633_23]